MNFEKLILELMCFSRNTFYVWKREERPIISLIEKYFSNEDLKEFLETGGIKKFENIKFITDNYIAKNQAFYVNSFKNSDSCLSEGVNNNFIDFYFYFLSNFGKIHLPSNTNFNGIHPLLIQFLYLYQMKEFEINKINENIEKLKTELLNDSKEISEQINEEEIKKHIEENLFRENRSKFRAIMKHYPMFNTWNDDMYYFLDLVKKDEFDYFINSKNDELLYQAVGYLVYSLSHNLNMKEKLQIISSIFHYFIFNRDLISSSNIKEHLFKRLENPESFSKIDGEIAHKYMTTPPPENDTNDLNSKEIIEVEEEISIEDFFKKYQNK